MLCLPWNLGLTLAAISPDVTGYPAEHAQEAEGQQCNWSHQLGRRKKFLRVRESRRGKADANQ